MVFFATFFTTIAIFDAVFVGASEEFRREGLDTRPVDVYIDDVVRRIKLDAVAIKDRERCERDRFIVDELDRILEVEGYKIKKEDTKKVLEMVNGLLEDSDSK